MKYYFIINRLGLDYNSELIKILDRIFFSRDLLRHVKI